RRGVLGVRRRFGALLRAVLGLPAGLPAVGSVRSLGSAHLRLLSCGYVGLVRLVGITCDREQRIAFGEIHQTDTLGLPARLAHLLRGRADDTAARRDGVQLVVVLDDACADKGATPAVVLDRQDALTAAALNRV